MFHLQQAMLDFPAGSVPPGMDTHQGDDTKQQMKVKQTHVYLQQAVLDFQLGQRHLAPLNRQLRQQAVPAVQQVLQGAEDGLCSGRELQYLGQGTLKMRTNQKQEGNWRRAPCCRSFNELIPGSAAGRLLQQESGNDHLSCEHRRENISIYISSHVLPCSEQECAC